MSSLYVYVTPECDRSAKKHNVTKNIQALQQKLEEEQSARGLDYYPRPYLKKNMGRHGRLAIEEYRMPEKDTVVLCFTKYFIRGSSDYDDFLHNTDSYYERNKVSKDSIADYLATRQKEPNIGKPQLSSSESDYIQPYDSTYISDEGAFLESYDWFERISQKWANSNLSRYYDLILDIENGDLPPAETVVTSTSNADVKILFRHFRKHKCIFLIAPLSAKEASDEAALREKYKDILTASEDDIDEDALKRASRRAYSFILAYNEDLWRAVEESLEANLALSPEEETILNSVRKTAQNDIRYPLFINGRPGSGKSTILQYLFADQLSRFFECSALEDAPLSSPLYLTYSPLLLEKARSAVRSILLCGADNVENERIVPTGEALDSTLKQCFQEFHSFLRSLLPVEVKEQFDLSDCVDFGRFKVQWERRCSQHPLQEVRDISAEMGWHAIRTFIKGMQKEPGEFVDPDYYCNELVRDLKSISDDKFRLIYEHVWKNWYEPLCRREGLWDDQDLTSAVLLHIAKDLSSYSAVFCDESQDFTQIELELIERLSLYSNRDVQSYLVKHVPFAFAGDPFQTLNPTGFNWSTLKASFHQNIVQQLDPSGAAKLEFNFKELSFNYRSSEHIVKLSNIVQLLRAVLLNIKQVQPQKTWVDKGSPSPAFFRKSDADSRAKIRDQQDWCIIIPCQENHEIEYIESDDFLSSFAIEPNEFGEKQAVRKVLSPARAKGMEYERVILYGFGEYAIAQLGDLIGHIDGSKPALSEIDQQLAWEYFLNQLYVAMSRAMKQLHIVDSAAAFKSFWSFTEAKRRHELLERYESLVWGPDDLGGIRMGTSADWSENAEDPFSSAQQLQSQARLQRDAYLMGLAKSTFERANRPDEAKLCEAEQYEFRTDFAKAAMLFANLGNAQGACRCHWINKDMRSVVHLAERFPEIVTDARHVAASAINADVMTAAQIDSTLMSSESVTLPSFPDGRYEAESWRWFFDQFVGKFCEVIAASNWKNTRWRPSVDRLIEVIARFEIPFRRYPDVAKLLYLAGDPAAALSHWNQYCSQMTQRQEDYGWLLRARAETEPYPANLQLYYELADYESVMQEWSAAGSHHVSTATGVLIDSAARTKNIQALRSLLPTCSDLAQIADVLKRVEKADKPKLAAALPVAIAYALESSGKWKLLIELATRELKDISNRKLRDVLEAAETQWRKDILIAAVIRVLSRSDRFSRSRAGANDIPVFLKQNLIIEKNANPVKQASVKKILSYVSLEEVGMAFERAYKLVFAFEFYEQFFSETYLSYRVLSPSEDQVAFAKRRWILCKYRLASMSDGQVDRNKNGIDAREKEQAWNISVDRQKTDPISLGNIEELSAIADRSSPIKPAAGAVSEPSSASKPHPAEAPATNLFKLSLENLELTAEKQNRKRRVVLTSIATEDQVTCGPDKVVSNDIDVEETHRAESLSIWKIEAWSMKCILTYSDGLTVQLFNDKNELIDRYRFP